RIYSTYGDGIDALVHGKVDFVRFGPVSYVLAKERNPHIRLLAMESNGGKKLFNGVISVPLGSPTHTLGQLQGKRIAFGNSRSTTGRYLAQAALARAGVYSEDLAKYVYMGRHDKVAFAVATGAYDAGATNENTFHKYAASKGLRKIAEFPCVTKPWAARQGMDEMLFEALREILLELRDPKVLKAIKRDGLLPAQDRDYDLIREGMRLAREFGEKSLTFAVYTSEKPSVVYQAVKPVLDVLEQGNAQGEGGSRFRIKIFRTYDGTIDALVHGDVDLGRLGPASYVLTKEQNPNIRLLAREANREREAEGVFVVAGDSPLMMLGQLRGKTMAFGNRRSTAGRYLAQATLVQAGIRAEDLKDFNYLGRHDRVIYAVAAGNYEAGVVRDKVYHKYGTAKGLKVIGRFATPEKIWVTRADLDDALFAAIRQNLLGITDKRALQVLG
ncbi:MAG: PhnD/SsuA/transferrin family substrate-binding protein, partial [Gammaproteobacteria bacterium]|nr:PhnD/SsuA/transferrin family substrate-binding protein [Gammaproteobacteria bacterium]